MPEHQVQQGETLLSIAKQHQFSDWRVIWDDPGNAELKRTRPNPMVLAPGDKVVVPDKKPAEFTVEGKDVYLFQLRALTCHFSVTLTDEQGQPYAGCRYALTVGEEVFEGVTPTDGLVAHEVPVDQVDAKLELWPSSADPATSHPWELKIGHLDPVDTVAGVQARLNNLGYKAGPVDGTMNDKTKEALKDFQRGLGMDPPTGEVDDATRAALVDAQRGF